MTQKTVIVFSLWTSVWAAIFYFFYTRFLGSFNVPWVMFVCMAIFFGMNMKPKQMFAAMLCAACGMAWGQVDFLLIDLFEKAGMGIDAASFLSIVLGTAVAMYVHLKLLADTPFRHMPYIFAGVCLTFSQNGGNILGLGITFVLGITLSALCMACLIYCSKRWPYVKKGKANSTDTSL